MLPRALKVYVRLHVQKKSATVRIRKLFCIFECDIISCEYILFRQGVAQRGACSYCVCVLLANIIVFFSHVYLFAS